MTKSIGRTIRTWISMSLGIILVAILSIVFTPGFLVASYTPNPVSIVPPTGDGSYFAGWVNTCSGGATVAIAMQAGMEPRTLSSTDIIVCTDVGTGVDMPKTGPLGDYAVTMPTPTTMGVSYPYVQLINNNATHNIALTPGSGWTINGYTTPSCPTEACVPPGETGFLRVDSTTSDNYILILSLNVPGPAVPAESDGDIIAGVSSAWAAVTALPNGITATTQSTADNTTKVATDAFVIANAGTGNAVSAHMSTIGPTIYGTTTSATNIVASATVGIYTVGVYIYLDVAGVGCSSASNTTTAQLNWTDPTGTSKSLQLSALSITGDGTKGSEEEVSTTVDAEASSAITVTVPTSTLSSTGCSTTPQYIVDAQAVR